MATLYVIEPGARIEREYGRILVSKDDEVLTSVPLNRLTEVVMIGSVGATTPALLSLLDAGVGLTFISGGGRLRGRLRPAEAHNLSLRHQQYARSQDQAFCLAVGRQIVSGKLHNCRILLQRWLRQPRHRAEPNLQLAGARAVADLERGLARVPTAPDLAGLRGIEGAAARSYFAAYRRLLGSDFSFGKRTRRPPKDPANALLSLSYSLLTQALFTAAEIVGLDAYDGFFHADKYGRPALALDLVEEFRPILADGLVLSLVNNQRLKASDFRPGEEGGVWLKPPALREFLTQFTRRLNQTVFHPLAGRPLTYQKIFEVQARQLRKAVEGEAEAYAPFRIR